MDLKHFMSLALKHDCYRCQSNPAYIYCKDCHNGFFCLDCDRHVHSLSTKRYHKRRPIVDGQRVNNADNDYVSYSLSSFRPSSPIDNPHFPPQAKSYQRSSSTIDISNNSISLKKLTMPQCCCNDSIAIHKDQNHTNHINEDDRDELLFTIRTLNKKLSHTTSDLNERIQYLSSQLDDIKQRHIEELTETKKRHTDLFDAIIIEKDDRINFLYDKVYQLEDINSQQRNKIGEYEELLNSSQCSHRDKMALANCHIDELINESMMIKEFYEKRIGEITNISAEQKNRIENDYEKAIETLKVGYETGKAIHLDIIQQKEKEIKDLMEKYQKEKGAMTEALDKQKENNDKHLREKVELIKVNNTLKKALDEAKAEVFKLTSDVNKHLNEQRILNEKIEKMKMDNEGLVSKSEKLNNMLFGRFKRKKTHIEQ